MLSAGLLKKNTRISHVLENNYWKFVNVSAMIIESHKYLFPVTRYMELKILCLAIIYCRIYYGK